MCLTYRTYETKGSTRMQSNISVEELGPSVIADVSEAFGVLGCFGGCLMALELFPDLEDPGALRDFVHSFCFIILPD